MHRPRKKTFRPHKQRSHDRPRNSDAKRGDTAAEEALLAQIHASGAASLADLIGEHGISNRQRKALKDALDTLCRRGVLSCSKQKIYTVAQHQQMYEGTISVNPRGFAFVTVDPASTEKQFTDDVFVPERAIGGARHGDRVLIQLTGTSDKGTSGRVINVLARGITSIVGTFRAGRPTGLVEPVDDRLPFRLVIRHENSLGAANGMAVVAELIAPDEGAATLREGRIVKVLGDPMDFSVQTEMVITAFDLPVEFSPATLAQAESLDPLVMPGKDRADLIAIPHITIDGETARDFDDAVAVQKTETGFRLYVSIADVSHYVTPGSALDHDAYQRGTSVYFPDRVLPMLPERLSNDLCSLVPNQNRFAFSAILDFDREGQLTKKRFTRSVINSRHRMTYTKVAAIVVDQDEATRTAYHDIVPMLEQMAELGRILENKRIERGSIGFELPEALVVVEDGKVTALDRRSRNQAHKIIEEFMLAANEAVAETFAKAGKRVKNILFLYRIHEPPDPQKVESFVEFATSLGLIVPPPPYNPAWFGKVLKQVLGTPREYIISNQMLRVMQQARYTPENAGHFGLAADFYCHFTSPIRRYPDLVVHRALALFASRQTVDTPPENADEAGPFLSKRERVAVDAERDIVYRAKALFLADKIGDTFGAIVSGVTSFGLFIELIEHHAGGAVAISDLADDYYELDDRLHRLLGRRSGRIYQIGQEIKVQLVRVDVGRRRCDFVIDETEERIPAEEDAAGSDNRTGPRKKRTKKW